MRLYNEMKPDNYTHMRGKPLKVLQITDTHLFAGSDGCLLGLNTEDSLKAVIANVSEKHLPADLILATGDLVHDGSTAAYQRFFSLMNGFELPVYCLPGNHDEAQTLCEIPGKGLCKYVDHAVHGDWHFIFLDSTIPGSEGAHLRSETLQQLDTLLREAPETHTLVCLHHQPVAMGSRWLDTMAVDNPREFFDIIDRHQQVRGIVWGHVHQELVIRRRDVSLMSAPSTCIQFLPGSAKFALDTAAPGYRWLNLHPDGRIETGIERICEMPGHIDMAASGY
jgi:Icc protein